MMSSSSASSCAASFGIETNPAREVGAHTDLTYFQDLILRHSSQYEQETTLGSTIPWSSGLTPFRQPTDELRPKDLQNGVLQAQISARKQPISSDTTDIENFVHATGRVFDGDECWHPAISYRNPLAEGVTLVTFNPGLQFQAKSRDTREDLSSKSLIIPAKLSLLQDLRADISLKEDFPQLIRCPNADHEETMKEERGARQWIAASERLRSVSSEIVFPSVLSQAQSCASSIESPNSISFDNNKSKILFASSKEKLQQATLSENISNRNLNSLEFAQENGRSLSRNLEGIDDDVGIDNKRSITKLLDSHYGDMDGYLKKSRLADPTPSIPLKTQTIQTHVRKEKLSDRITALQQLVSPFGKTDTASVLLEAIGYIKFLQEQVQVLSSPYMKPKSHQDFIQVSLNGKVDGSEPDLRSRGLCLMPVSCTLNVANTNGADYWASGMGGGNRY